jgi:hypothetical protein
VPTTTIPKKPFLKLKPKSKSKSKYKAVPRRPLKEGSFTEVERAILLRGVIDALRSKPNAPRYSVWRRFGLSRLYFEDSSWLSYDPQGTAIYGPSKETTAYAVRSELGLTRRARKGRLRD